MKISLFIFLGLFIILLIGGVIYITWENRDSNKLVFKVLSFFIVGLLSIILTVLLQDKKEEISYHTTTSLFVDNNDYPIIYTKNIEKKDNILIHVLTSVNNVNFENESYENKSDYQFDLISRSVVNLFETLFMGSWYISYKHNDLTGGTSWGNKGNVKSDFININEVDIFTSPNFKVEVIGLNKNGFNVPKGTKVSFINDKYSKMIILKHKYFTYKIEISQNGNHIGFGKYFKLFNQVEGRTYYFDIKTSCIFSELYPNNPMIKKYEEWVKNTNNIIDFYFNSFKNLDKYKVDNEQRRLIPGNYTGNI